ncbi:MAG: hypothetical protein COA78_05190 [Blastopirellula sp.]|nr:MAG: hypothetical protein COA78_05190 [Blastopirellula sp.]
MNSTAFILLPDHNVVIKPRIELPSKDVSRQVAKAQRKKKKKLLTQRHRELGFRLHLVDHVYLVKKIYSREASKSRRDFASNFLGAFATLRDFFSFA